MSPNSPHSSPTSPRSRKLVRYLLLFAALAVIGFAYRLATQPAPPPPLELKTPMQSDLGGRAKHEEWE